MIINNLSLKLVIYPLKITNYYWGTEGTLIGGSVWLYLTCHQLVLRYGGWFPEISLQAKVDGPLSTALVNSFTVIASSKYLNLEI